ncbi:cytochrome P450 [Streptomyces inusitatus]|uniref:Cytochrome P450 n=1 Tax=Streptomyces inusitatus TaxID=68221 RepID=A0A918V289_9ACTN|nr:cytochrome P450 [Streptomyces inusitatus]GGZ59553.1 cytochrome P450 [Streptomyces inusitatus]
MKETIAFPQSRSCPYAPPAEYSALREAGPLTRVSLYDGRAVWAVTGHALARRLLADPRLSTNRDNQAFPVTSARFTPMPGRRRVALLGFDDPEHNAQRRMLIPGFTLKRVAGLRPSIGRTVDRLLDSLVAQGPPAELVSAFALPVPSMVICDLLGVPYADHDFFQTQSRVLLRGPSPEDVVRARALLEEYLGGLIDERFAGAADGDELLDELVRRQRAEGRRDREELVGMALILLVAGHETTANMISLGVFTLLRHPERLAELRADESLMPAAVDELMRFLSIVDGMLRVAVADIEVAGETIRAHDGVVFTTSLINRDSDAFPAPDALDWHRAARHHVGFGYGVHQCLGQNLARAEMEIALRSLFVRLPGLRLTVPAERVPFKPGDTLQGMVELPVAW